MEKLVQEAYFSAEAFKMHTHYHDCHQIMLILKGRIEICVNDAKYTAGPGNLVLLGRCENHSIQSLLPEYERYVLRISPLAGSSENRIYSLLSNRPSGFHNILDVSARLPEFTQLFAQITKEHSSREKLADEMLQLSVNELLIHIYRLIPEDSYFLEEENFEMVSDLQRRFENHCQEAYTLDALAKEYNVSVSQLSHQFKKITGSSVMGYLLSCRLATAKNLLAQTNLNVGEIVEKCGFSDCSNFSRTFKHMNGMSPTEFRNSVAARVLP